MKIVAGHGPEAPIPLARGGFVDRRVIFEAEPRALVIPHCAMGRAILDAIQRARAVEATPIYDTLAAEWEHR